METVLPESVGLSSQRLARLTRAMQAYVDQGKLAGMITAIARRGHVAHMCKYGMMDIEAGKPMQFDTLFRIYSMTKPITSVAVMMLYEEGRFHLSDPVSRFIPGFADVRVFERKTDSGIELADLAREITIRDLLTHTAGLSYGFDEDSYVDSLYQKHILEPSRQDPDCTLEQMANEFVRLPLAHQPGTTWHYSMATDVLGYLVQVVAGVHFEDYLQERVLQPLGMVDTSFAVPPEKLARFAATYGPAKEGGLALVDAPATSRFARPTRCPSGGGGLISTVNDYMRFAQMLLDQGRYEGGRLLSRKSVELMTANHIAPGMRQAGFEGSGFGLGFAVVTDPTEFPVLGSVGAYGWDGAASTVFWVDPCEALIGLLMVQFVPADHSPILGDFRVLVYQAIDD